MKNNFIKQNGAFVISCTALVFSLISLSLQLSWNKDAKQKIEGLSGQSVQVGRQLSARETMENDWLKEKKERKRIEKQVVNEMVMAACVAHVLKKYEKELIGTGQTHKLKAHDIEGFLSKNRFVWCKTVFSQNLVDANGKESNQYRREHFVSMSPGEENKFNVAPTLYEKEKRKAND